MKSLVLAFALIFCLGATAEAKHPHRSAVRRSNIRYRHNYDYRRHHYDYRRPSVTRDYYRRDYLRYDRGPTVIYDSRCGVFRIYYSF